MSMHIHETHKQYHDTATGALHQYCECGAELVTGGPESPLVLCAAVLMAGMLATSGIAIYLWLQEALCHNVKSL